MGCAKTGDRIARHNMLRDVLFEAASSADLGPSKEERHLLPGTIARPCDVTIRRWMNGKDGAIDVTAPSHAPMLLVLLPRRVLPWQKPARGKKGTPLKPADGRE